MRLRVATLLPFFEKHPAAFDSLMAFLAGNYLSVCEKVAIKPDVSPVAPGNSNLCEAEGRGIFAMMLDPNPDQLAQQVWLFLLPHLEYVRGKVLVGMLAQFRGAIKEDPEFAAGSSGLLPAGSMQIVQTGDGNKAVQIQDSGNTVSM